MIRRPSDLWIPSMLSEYRRLAAMPVLPVTIRCDPTDPHTTFSCTRNVSSAFWAFCYEGQDYAGLLATVCWLREGPKIANVTEEQFQALRRVEVRLEVSDFKMPFPSLLVNMPVGKMYRCVILHSCLTPEPHKLPIMIGASISRDHMHDIVNVARQREGIVLEESITKFIGDVTEEEGEGASSCLRVACNMALAMTNFGCQAEWMFPKEVEAEKKFVKKGNRAGRDGRRASDRLAEQPMLVFLDRNVKLYHKEGSREGGVPTGSEMAFHWRRGHWHTVLCGKGKKERKLVLYPPCMVRADLMPVASAMDTTTTYHR